MNRRRKGAWWEGEAARHLEEAGYAILARNYRTRTGEIDLIACKENLVVFVEVKMRSSEAFGRPEEAIDTRKQKKIIEIAKCYLAEHPCPALDIRFDVIAITSQGAERNIKHFEDAFRVEDESRGD